ncbi:hypothetical protein TVAG_262060 [Trichomonas vaginalis G3]|uniref:MORN repeat family protein n=1 Tax=Trichomonas vaginalis (strain ATCC PRA-98 / G3) TaxID=412133 RepID=A2DUB8_TRIV3|nr:MORN repeat-containing protein family [Trichomonas vaginalis G3]EAY15956.1 hypothetical protein TVAG_262060 [Trichomonas vaginalis G3]KAI5523590.1 MORN repeat-containing protein family [Trichomonas vaginalis G3]|eukprot:XP_001328179.1 hypothetical protein [Trichomonas vaginalis G3]
MTEEKQIEYPKYGPREKFVHPPNKDGIAQYNYANPLFSYIGDWKNGKKDGHGKFFIGKNSYYEGDFRDGEMTGNGKRVFPNGSVYEGEFIRGEFCGKGKYTDAASGEVYVGDWKDNKRTGEGVLTLPNGTEYSGHFERHKRNGFGKYTNSNGEKYEGEWVDNRIEGKGKMVYANGDVYEGDFVNGLKQGQGTMIWASSGLSVIGEWKDDKCLYNPTGLTISELPPFTPGTILQNITINITGGDGESGRVLSFMIEIGRIDPNAPQKKQPKPKKNETISTEPKYFVIDPNTGETTMNITTEKGIATIPPLTIPQDAEQSTYTLIVNDMSEKDPLPQAIADFNFVPPAAAVSEKTSAKGKAPAKKSVPAKSNARGRK